MSALGGQPRGAAPASDPLCDTVIALCGAMARVTSPPLKTQSELDRDRLATLLARHGLPDLVPGEDLRLRRQQAGENLLALAQLAEIASAFERLRIRLIALKGVAAILTLYAEEIRPLVDLDLLVEERAIADARAALVSLGYAPLPTRSTRREEELLMTRSHLQPYLRPGRLPVEIHVDILQGWGRSELAMPAVWRDAIPVTSGGARLYCLSSPHFFIHTAVHFSRDLHGGFASLKGLADLLLAVQHSRNAIDWRDLWETARIWGVEREVATVAATLNAHWEAGIPGIPAGAMPLARTVLVYGFPDRPERSARAGIGAYAAILARTRELPDTASRMEYLFRLVFPTPDKLRYWYDIPPGRSLIPYYLQRPFRLTGRILKRLWTLARHRRPRPEGPP